LSNAIEKIQYWSGENEIPLDMKIPWRQSGNAMNETQPNRSDWPAVVGLIFLFTIIGAAPLLLPVNYLYLNSPSTKPPFLLTICTFIPGFLFGVWYARKILNKERWQLTATELICGYSGKKVFPLASIEKAIVGLPTGIVGEVLKRDKAESVVSAGLDTLSVISPIVKTVRRNYLPARKDALLLCFKDGSLLPLRLHALSNGLSVMTELQEKLSNRLIYDYDYSPEEIKRLRTRDINELIPAQKQIRL
jgi:hypothetical protein